jgi:hypothetical protein
MTTEPMRHSGNIHDDTLFSTLYEEDQSIGTAYFINFVPVSRSLYIERLYDAQLADIDATCTALTCPDRWHFHTGGLNR